MLTTLHPHQEQGVKWLLSVEPQIKLNTSSIFGGILGDEMGLGKLSKLSH